MERTDVQKHPSTHTRNDPKKCANSNLASNALCPISAEPIQTVVSGTFHAIDHHYGKPLSIETIRQVRHLTKQSTPIEFATKSHYKKIILWFLDTLEIPPQGPEPFVAIDIFAVRQDQAEQFRISGPQIVDGLSHSRQELVEPIVGEMNPRDQRLQSCQR